MHLHPQPQLALIASIFLLSTVIGHLQVELVTVANAQISSVFWGWEELTIPGSRCGRSQWRGVLAPPHPSHLPFPGWSFSMGSAYQFHSWRVFVIVCALPCASSVVALTFMPESPRFLLEVMFIITNTQGSQRH